MHVKSYRAPACICGGKVWHTSRVTLFERLGWWLGLMVPVSNSGLMPIAVPLGGDPDQVKAAWEAAQKEMSHGK